MDIKLSLFHVLLLMGMVQGFIISVLIWWKKEQQPDKLVLSFLLTVFNLVCLKIILLSSGLWQRNWLRYFPLPFDLAIQPLLFLYITSVTSSRFRLHKKHALHFIPFFISLGYSLFVYIGALSFSQPEQKDGYANRFLFNQVKEVEDFLSLCSAVVYWYLCLQLLLRYRKWLYDHTANTLYPTYEWLRNVMVLLGLFFLALALNIALDYGLDYGANHFLHWQLLFVYLAVLIYYLGFRGYQINPLPGTTLTASDEQQLSLAKTEDEQTRDGGEAAPSAVAATTQVKPQVLPNKGLGALILKLISEEKLYLDPEFSLEKLAQRLSMSQVAVSRVINSELNKNFRNLVNEYRIEEVKMRLTDSRASQFSLLGIAYECGFNSEASFYRIFKNMVGLSPKEYLLRQKD